MEEFEQKIYKKHTIDKFIHPALAGRYEIHNEKEIFIGRYCTIKECKMIINIEKIYDRCFERYISPSQYDKMDRKGYIFETWPFSGGMEEAVKIRVEALLDKGYFVTSGYMATDIKNYHRRYIIYK